MAGWMREPWSRRNWWVSGKFTNAAERREWPPLPTAPKPWPKCLKIVGPGSPWVLAAKRLLSTLIDPGVPAGPSESIILAIRPPTARWRRWICSSKRSTVPIPAPTWSPTAGASPRQRSRPCRRTGGNGSAARRILPPGPQRQQRRNRAHAGVFRCDCLRQRLRARASRNIGGGTHGRAGPDSQCRGGIAGQAHADHARQLHPRRQCGFADGTPRADALASVRIRLHEAHLRRIRDPAAATTPWPRTRIGSRSTRASMRMHARCPRSAAVSWAASDRSLCSAEHRAASKCVRRRGACGLEVRAAPSRRPATRRRAARILQRR